MDRLTVNQQIGRVVRAKRNLMGLVRRELAEELAVPEGTLVAIELGHRAPSADFMADFDSLFKRAHDRAKIFPLNTMGDFIAKAILTTEEKAFINILLLATTVDDMAAFLKDEQEAHEASKQEDK